jgi:hypothetical protein
MAIQIDSTRDALAQTYSGLGKFGGLTVGDPGSGPTPQGEPGDSDYHRGLVNWTDDGGGKFSGQCNIHAGAGNNTFTHVILCSDPHGAMIDFYELGSPLPVGPGGVVAVDLAFEQS